MSVPYLESGRLMPDLYNTSNSPLINDIWSPVCASNYGSTVNPQYFDKLSRKCVPLPKEAFSSLAQSMNSGKCNGFQQLINGKCYNTNNCPVYPGISQACLNGENVVVRADPLAGSGPGILINGPANNSWQRT